MQINQNSLVTWFSTSFEDDHQWQMEESEFGGILTKKSTFINALTEEYTEDTYQVWNFDAAIDKVLERANSCGYTLEERPTTRGLCSRWQGYMCIRIVKSVK